MILLEGNGEKRHMIMDFNLDVLLHIH